MAAKPETDAQKVLEGIRAESYSASVSSKMLKTVYAIEHDKQFEDDRGPIEAALREIITETVEDIS